MNSLFNVNVRCKPIVTGENDVENDGLRKHGTGK